MERRPNRPARPVAGSGAHHHPATPRRGEVRLPAAIALAVGIALYALLPGQVLFAPRFVLPSIELALLISLLLINPLRMTVETRYSRIASLALLAIMLGSNNVSLVVLVRELVSSHVDDGSALLVAALQVWLTNVIGFALTYWEMDRGGAVARTRLARTALPSADFRFTQDEDHDTVREVAARSSKVGDWVPSFIDYLYVSITNSTAFSPTDTMPLSARAKVLMGLQSVAALITSLLVIARGVSLIQ